MRKSSGPNTDPCGTPHLMVKLSELIALYFTICSVRDISIKVHFYCYWGNFGVNVTYGFKTLILQPNTYLLLKSKLQSQNISLHSFWGVLGEYPLGRLYTQSALSPILLLWKGPWVLLHDQIFNVCIQLLVIHFYVDQPLWTRHNMIKMTAHLVSFSVSSSDPQFT